MTDPKPAVTMREIREGVWHAEPCPPEILVQTTEVEVSVLPEGDINRPLFTLTIAYRGDDKWAVVRHGQCLSVDGAWDYELRPSEREDEWLASHRFDFQTALKIAAKEAPGIRCNGQTAVDAWRRTQGEASS